MEDIASSHPNVPLYVTVNEDAGGTDSGRRKGRCDGAKFCVRVVTWAILLCFVSLMVCVGIAWDVMNPHELGFHVGSISVSNFTASDSKLERKYEVGLSIKKTNEKVKVSLDHFKVWVCYGEARLTEGIVEGMYLEKMSEKDLVSSSSDSGSAELVGNGKVSGDMGKEWRRMEETTSPYPHSRRRCRFVFAPSQDPTIYGAQRNGLDPTVLRSLPVLVFQPKDTSAAHFNNLKCHLSN